MSLFDFVTEDLINESEAKEITEPFWPQIEEVWRASFAKWNAWPEDDRRRICETPTARPGVINALAQSFAKELFLGREAEGIIPCDGIPGVFAFYVQKKVLVRFNNLCSNYTIRFHGAKPYKRKYLLQIPLPKLNNSASRITAGYVLDASQTAIEGIHLSMQVGSICIFHFPTDGEAGAVKSLPSPKSAPTLTPPKEGIARKKTR